MVPGTRPQDYPDYFVFAFPLSVDAWDRYAVDALSLIHISEPTRPY